MQTKSTVTYTFKKKCINLMSLISRWYGSYWTSENPIRYLKGNYYQQRTLSFNGWMKWAKQFTGNMQTKLFVASIKKWEVLNQWELFPLVSPVI